MEEDKKIKRRLFKYKVFRFLIITLIFDNVRVSYDLYEKGFSSVKLGVIIILFNIILLSILNSISDMIIGLRRELRLFYLHQEKFKNG